MEFAVLSAPDPERFAREGAALVARAIRRGIAQDGRAVVGLSGGSTPRPVYERLATEGIDWSKVWLFLVDERCVPPDDPRSNQYLLRSSLLRTAPVPESHLVAPDTRLPPEEAVLQYGLHLKDLVADRLPHLVVLGMGEDGHVASLFPPVGEEGLGDSRLVLRTATDRFEVRDRITVSLNMLAAADEHLFLLGASKRGVWEAMLAGGDDDARWPAKRILAQGRATIVAGW